MFDIRRRRRPRVEIIPMIDVMFYLVVFFMVFSTFKTETAGMPVDLPRAATPAELAQQHIVVSIDSQARLYLRERAVSPSELTQALQPELRREPDKLVVIKADRTVRYERLIQAIDAIRQAGGRHLALAVERAMSPAGGGR